MAAAARSLAGSCCSCGSPEKEAQEEAGAWSRARGRDRSRGGGHAGPVARLREEQRCGSTLGPPGTFLFRGYAEKIAMFPGAQRAVQLPRSAGAHGSVSQGRGKPGARLTSARTVPNPSKQDRGHRCFHLCTKPWRAAGAAGRCGCRSERAHVPGRAPLRPPHLPRGRALPARRSYLAGMSRWLRRIWGGMRLCGNTAPIEQVATKQREVFRRLCNMYTVTSATARPEGISRA